MAEKLTKKQKEFARNYLDTGNATKSVIEAGYDVKNNEVARSIGSENLTKPNIIEYLSSQADAVASNMVRLALSAESEQVQCAAGKDILDRAGYKPVDKSDIMSGGEKINQVLVEFINGKPKDNTDTRGISKTV